MTKLAERSLDYLSPRQWVVPFAAVAAVATAAVATAAVATAAAAVVAAVQRENAILAVVRAHNVCCIGLH